MNKPTYEKMPLEYMSAVEWLEGALSPKFSEVVDKALLDSPTLIANGSINTIISFLRDVKLMAGVTRHTGFELLKLVDRFAKHRADASTSFNDWKKLHAAFLSLSPTNDHAFFFRVYYLCLCACAADEFDIDAVETHLAMSESISSFMSPTMRWTTVAYLYYRCALATMKRPDRETKAVGYWGRAGQCLTKAYRSTRQDDTATRKAVAEQIILLRYEFPSVFSNRNIGDCYVDEVFDEAMQDAGLAETAAA